MSEQKTKAPKKTRKTIMKENEKIRIANGYSEGTYWAHRMDMMYYQYVDYIMRTLTRDATSMIDVGTANCPYQEDFDWIPERVSFDQVPPYSSDTVTGVQGDFLKHDFGREFDVATCLQVLEHVPKARTFARKLLKISKLVIISVPYKWPAHRMDEHIHDPVDEEKLLFWTGRKPNFSIVVEEPFKAPKRMIAVYDRDQSAKFGTAYVRKRIHRKPAGPVAD